MKKIIILLLLCSFHFVVKSQRNFKPGYIISNNNDTIWGEIDSRVDLLMSQRCNFRSENKEITTFYPGSIKGYRFIDGKYFVSQNIDGNLLFVEYLIKGTISIYYVNDISGERYYISKNDSTLTEIPYFEEVKEIDNKKVKYVSNRYKGILNYYMGDAPDLYSRISKLNKPDHSNLINLAENYHKTVCKDEDCIIYEKKLPFLKINIEPIIGFTHYIDDKFSRYEYGGFLYLWLPRANENFYLKTGVSFHAFDNRLYNQVLNRFSIQFEYVYPSKIFRPKLSLGYTTARLYTQGYLFDRYYGYYDYGGTPTISAGFNIKVFKSVFYSLSYRYEIVTYSIITGIYFQL